MINKLKEQVRGVYTKVHLEELEKIEQLLRFDNFTNSDAYVLGSLIIAEARKTDAELIVYIKNEEDHSLMYQYIGENMTQRNIDFAMMKRNAVLISGHCSLWPLIKESVDGGQAEVFANGSGCLPVGGSFPIYVNNVMVATISLSGLHDGLDFTIAIRALASYHDIEEPVFHGKCI